MCRLQRFVHCIARPRVDLCCSVPGQSIEQIQSWFEPRNLLKYITSGDGTPPPAYQAYVKGFTTFYLAYYLLFVSSYSVS